METETHRERIPPDEAPAPVAVLFQALPAPVIDGVRKPAKPGGYADSGADIACALREAGCPVVTPVANPDPRVQQDWVFGDDAAGIAAARAAGARVLWANTVLFTGHPLEAVLKDVWVVGQEPRTVETFDDKSVTNATLRRAGCPVAASVLVSASAAPGRLGLDRLGAADLEAHGLRFPLMLKPLRGRGSQGVVRVRDLATLQEVARRLLAAREDGGARFGDTLLLEQYLDGEELTVTVMPAGAFERDGVPDGGSTPGACRPYAASTTGTAWRPTAARWRWWRTARRCRRPREGSPGCRRWWPSACARPGCWMWRRPSASTAGATSWGRSSSSTST